MSITKLLMLPRNLKRLIVFLIDVMIYALTIIIATGLDQSVQLDVLSNLSKLIIISIVLGPLTLFYFGFYKAIFRFFSIEDFFEIFKSIIVFTIIFWPLLYLIGLKSINIGLIINHTSYLLILLTGWRVLGFLIFDYFDRSNNNQIAKNAIIYGAGSLGRGLSKAFSLNKSVNLVGFIDDDNSLQSNMINGIEIYNPEKLPLIIKKRMYSKFS